MTLSDWIDKTGQKKVARIADVNTSTVSMWKCGRALPRPKSMVAICKASKGRVSYKTMIETFAKNQRAN